MRRNHLLLKLIKKGAKKKIDKASLESVRIEVVTSFEKSELASYKSFEEFFADVDVQNAYEEEWEPEKWKPHFKAIWDEFRAGKLKFNNIK